MSKIIMMPCAFGVSAIQKNKRVSCVVSKTGKSVIDIKKNKVTLNKKFNIFFVRGLFFVIYNMYYLFLGLYDFGKIYKKDNIKILNKSKNSLNVSVESLVVFICLICGMSISFLLFGVLPIKISYYLSPKNFDIFFKRIIVGIIKCILIYIMLLLLKMFSTFEQYYKFNSAIKTIQEEKEQINFLTYFICTIFLNVIVLSVVGLSSNFWYSYIVNFVITIVVFCINYELFKKIQASKQIRWIILPFYFLIKEKPSQIENKCVNIVLKELEIGDGKNMEDIKGLEQIAFSEAYVNAKEKLEQFGKFEKSDLDFIFCEVLGKNRAELRLVKSISKEDLKKVNTVVERRCLGEPITKIFEHTNFYGLDFKVTKDVLSPRMDTEVLVEQVLKDCTPKSKILDIGTGSGAIAITIAHMCKCKVMAVDISDKALSVAKQNAKLNGVKVNFKISDLFSEIGALSKFDIIVSNPPYIPSRDVEELEDEVKKFDPAIALDGGESGLDFYERIISEAPKKLNKNGKIFLEVGINQAKDVKKLLQNSFKDIKIVKDFNKIDRVVIATLK